MQKKLLSIIVVIIIVVSAVAAVELLPKTPSTPSAAVRDIKIGLVAPMSTQCWTAFKLSNDRRNPFVNRNFRSKRLDIVVPQTLHLPYRKTTG